MISDLATHASNTHDLTSWNQSILNFHPGELEAASTDRASLDQRISMSLAELFGEQAPVAYNPCDDFYCSSYWPVT